MPSEQLCPQTSEKSQGVMLGAAGSAEPRPDPALLQVNFNEPLSMLQRLTEDLEYHHLLDKAVHCTSSVEQMCLVAAFSVSSYSTTVHRIAKPFNPMLGETFELDRLEDMGLRSLCEQVRPPAPARPGARMRRGGPSLRSCMPVPRSCPAEVQSGSGSPNSWRGAGG